MRFALACILFGVAGWVRRDFRRFSRELDASLRSQNRWAPR